MAYPRALSWFVFIGSDENVDGWALPIVSVHHHSAPVSFHVLVLPGFDAIPFLGCAGENVAASASPILSRHHRLAPDSFQKKHLAPLVTFHL